MVKFDWNKIQYRDDGKVLLLYRHERVFEEGLVEPGMEILDVGGWGHFTERCEQEGAKCIVMDNFSPDQYYAERVKTKSFINDDICTCHVRAYTYSNLFDLITCFETLEHVSDQKAAVKNIFTMLKSGGRFVGTVPIPGHCHFIGEEGIQFLDSNQLFLLLDDTGFEVDLITPTPSLNKEGEVPSSLYFVARKP